MLDEKNLTVSNQSSSLVCSMLFGFVAVNINFSPERTGCSRCDRVKRYKDRTLSHVITPYLLTLNTVSPTSLNRCVLVLLI